MAMGPFAVDDLAGIDVGWRVRKEYPQLSPPGQRAPKVPDRLYELGRYGQKTGAGWYRYKGDRTAVPDPEVQKLIEETARQAGVTRRKVPAEEMVERPVFSFQGHPEASPGPRELAPLFDRFAAAVRAQCPRGQV